MNVVTINLGAISNEQQHEKDCELYQVVERLSMFDDVSASYQISRKDKDGNYSDNEKDDVIVTCYDGFEQYWQASNDIGY